MVELLVSNIPEVGHPPVPVTEEGGVRFCWLWPELGDASCPPVSESGLKAACFAAFFDLDLDPPW